MAKVNLGEVVNAMIFSKNGLTIGTQATSVSVPISVGKQPKAIIAVPQGGAPFYCSVNYWSQTEAVIGVKAEENLTNRSIQIIAIL